METKLFMSVIQNLFAICWFSLNMHIGILHCKCTLSIDIYITTMVIIFLCQDIFIHVDDSVPVSLRCLHRTLACCFVSDAHSPTEFSKNKFFFVNFFLLLLLYTVGPKNRLPNWIYCNFWSFKNKFTRFCMSIFPSKPSVKVSRKSMEYSQITATLKCTGAKNRCQRFFEFCKIIKS